MRRLLIFPSVFALWFGVGQFGLTVLDRLSLYLTLQLILNRVQVHILRAIEFSFPYVLRVAVFGAFIGVVFALLDFAFHRQDTKIEETLLYLLNHLLKAGVLAVALVLIYYGTFKIPMLLQLLRTPRYRYTPYHAIWAWGNLLLPLPLLFSVLWAMGKTLRRQTH